MDPRNSIRDISRRFAVSHHALGRHMKRHISAAVAVALDKHTEALGIDVLAECDRLRNAALQILEQAIKAKQGRTALAAIREARETLKMQGAILFEAQRQRQQLDGMDSSGLTDEEAGRRFLALLSNEELDQLAEFARRIQAVEQ
jgi:hypothetical protein